MINKVVLMGRLTKDPEMRYTASQLPVASFTLAVERSFVKQGEERQADFINISAFSKTAEFVSKYFVKGQLVAVVGRIQTRSWDDNEGKKRYATDVVAEEVHFAESKRDGNSNAQRPSNNDYQSPATDNDFIETETDEENLPF